ncbi:MAG: GGDEF domain-containing protein [Gammaproteobacteria bacterium]|nr:GGDEF domain-containing protein [Gammaproteobacteria bacterium]MDH3806537.1 GGDEF domain-containing protein [Gammaproteobacteria bacterium]
MSGGARLLAVYKIRADTDIAGRCKGRDLDGRHSISIAVLTDNQDDVALINGTLRDAGHAAHCHWINNPKDLGKTLSAENVELLILNCDSYQDSVRQVIKQKDRFNPEVPVIALQTEADEASIQKAMANGACDLVSIGLKDRLKSVVTRELRALRVERALNSTIHSATEYKKQLKDYMQSSASAIALVEQGIITDVNDAWLSLFRSASNDEVVGLPLMDNFESESQAAIKGALIAAIEGKWAANEKLIARSHITSDDTNEVHLEFRKFSFDNEPCVQVRITPDRSSEEPTKLVHDALKRDPTTLFFHRAQFLDRIKKRLSRKPSSGTHVLAYVRVDNFSGVLEKVGILNSDEILAQFAEVVRKRMHPRDVAGRFEGTALMVLLERGRVRDAEVWGKQLCKNIRNRTFEVEDRSTNLTCTVGVCAANEIFSSLEEFVAATIDAYNMGMEAGGNTAMLSESADEDSKQKEFDAIWVKHLKSALMDDRFRLAQLPIAGLRSDGIEMYDLLVRMLDEQGNSVLPSEFLPAAERNNMMKNIDRWMIRAAMDFCHESEADRVFVRLSRQSVLDTTTIAWMEQEFDDVKFDCTRLVMQIPERDAAKHIKQTRAIVKQLRKMGVGFAIEHYGVDQERFQILDILKPDYIKVDGELMHTLMTDPDMQKSVEKIVRAAAERDIKSIAERVENANAMAVLFQLGLDYMQGHYVNEPEVVLQATTASNRVSLAELTAAKAG